MKVDTKSGDSDTTKVSLAEFVGYFLWLGTVGFGGPIALAGHMQQDLVDQRGWIRKEDYLEGLALAQLAPGPLAAQLAIYLGYIRAGIFGATAVAVAFVLPSFLMVLGLSAAYVRYGGLPWMQGMFYGIGAAVIGIITRSAFKLTKLTLGKDKLLWGIFTVLAVSTAWTSREIIWLFLLGGVVAVAVKAFPSRAPMTAASAFLVPLAIGGTNQVLLEIFVYFAKAGLFVFGSGLAVVPFLYGGVVHGHHWLTDHQFVDAVAVAMITPGPVVITVAFIGYLVAGVKGATAAAMGIFVPVYLVVILLAPSYKRWVKNPQLNAFVRGVTAAATGAIAGAVVVLARRSVYDIPTV
ncbi:MAG TPA: chromate transporter, partial [Candidatus Sulfotelmatobacter sp.]